MSAETHEIDLESIMKLGLNNAYELLKEYGESTNLELSQSDYESSDLKLFRRKAKLLTFSDSKEIIPVTEEDVTWLTKLSDEGNPFAQNNLGYFYNNNLFVEKDFKKAYELYLSSAEQGFTVAQCNLGFAYLHGVYVEKDLEKSFDLYLTAAKNGSIKAMCVVAKCYYDGEGVDKSFEKSLEWYILPAEKGDKFAQYQIGFMYYGGLGVDKNYEIALKWFTLALEQGYWFAEFYLGCIYYYGDYSVKKDIKKAYEYFLSGADRKITLCLNTLGNLYFKGVGNVIQQNYDKSAYYYQSSIENSSSQFSLGYMYECGFGVKQDYNEAFNLYKMAKENGKSDVESSLARVAGLIE